MEETSIDVYITKLKRLETLDAILMAIGLDKYNYVRYKAGLLKITDEYLGIVAELRALAEERPDIVARIEGLSAYLIDADVIPLITRRVVETAETLFREVEE